MGLSVKAGSFASNTSTGNQSISDVGFQPKVVLFMSADRSAAGSANAGQPIFGVAVSDTEQWSIAGLSEDSSPNANTFRHAHNDRCLHHGDGAATNMQLDFVSMDAGGFTVNVADAPASALIVPYLALGGTDIQVKAGTFSVATSGSPQSVTGVGFEPDLVIVGHIGRISWPQTNAQHMVWGLGAFTASEQAAFAVSDQDAAANMLTNAYQRSDSMILECFTDLEITRCAFSSMDSGGFTFTVPNLPDSVALACGYVAIAGARWKVGVETKPTTVTTKATSGVGFQPTGLMLMGAMKTSGTTVVPESRTTIGFADGTSQFQTASASNDGVGSSNTSRRLSTTNIVGRIEGSETLTSEADLDSLDSDGFTLDWTTSDATSHEFIYLAMAGDAVAPADFLPKVIAF